MAHPVPVTAINKCLRRREGQVQRDRLVRRPGPAQVEGVDRNREVPGCERGQRREHADRAQAQIGPHELKAEPVGQPAHRQQYGGQSEAEALDLVARGEPGSGRLVLEAVSS